MRRTAALPTLAVLLLVCVSPKLAADWPGTEAERPSGSACNCGADARQSWAGPQVAGRTRKRSPLDLAAPVGGLPPALTHSAATVEHHGAKLQGAGLVSTHSAVISHGVERVVAPPPDVAGVGGGGPAPPVAAAVVPVLQLLSSAKVTKTSVTVDHGPPGSIPAAATHAHQVTVVTGVLHHVVVAAAAPVHVLQHDNVFRSHLGGHGEGLGFGGHGSGHGFFV